jgi:hypothetical protein
MAVGMRNPVAVAALVEAGADIDIQDPVGSNVIKVARSAIIKLLSMDAASKPKDVERELNRAFQTLSVLAGWKSWPDDLRLNHQVKKAL